ncbi:DUF4142 domain-containing protein [Pinibacter aurantiacus]|uniref:DUF4142 domain-containing protein n=1 Tax=Pinibacter aurantiacus TaxID=2851599 RepID=A0A9E2SEN3_9BACT|nr:DUF4142 domain-containing protein [Pinibacter aurantiacus]MBV4358690.1 DUF4142 domain-containing protein [Pinibacter aurantiacus]
MQTDTREISSSVTAQEFRSGVMPRAQLSMMASQLAVDKATQKNAKEFAGFELMEAITVIDVLKDVGTPTPPLSQESQAFLMKLKELEGDEFDKTYMQAELSNHEFLRDLAQDYLSSTDETTSASEKETKHLAKVALYAFKEHVAMSKRIYGELTA